MRVLVFVVLALLLCAGTAFEKPKDNAKDKPVKEAPKAANPATTDDSDDNGVFTFSLEHAIGDEFKTRGSVEIRFSLLKTSVRFSEAELTGRDLSDFNALVEKRGLYRLRLIPTTKGASQDHVVVASVPACALQFSGFREFFTFNADVYGNVIGLEYRPQLNECPDKLPPLSGKAAFSSKGKLSQGRAGERPKEVRTLAQQEEAKVAEAAGGKEQKSFLQQYWMYLLPVGLVLLMQMISPPPEAKK